MYHNFFIHSSVHGYLSCIHRTSVKGNPHCGAPIYKVYFFQWHFCLFGVIPKVYWNLTLNHAYGFSCPKRIVLGEIMVIRIFRFSTFYYWPQNHPVFQSKKHLHSLGEPLTRIIFFNLLLIPTIPNHVNIGHFFPDQHYPSILFN